MEFQYLPYNRKPLKAVVHGQFHVLAAKVNARMELLGEEKLLPGGKAAAVVATARPIAVAAGDPFVIRGYGIFTTIGGGRVLHPMLSGEKDFFLSGEALRVLAGKDLKAKIDLYIKGQDAKGVSRTELSGIFNEIGVQIDKCIGDLKKDRVLYEDEGGRLYHRDLVLALRREIVTILASYHQRNDLRLGMGREELFQKTASSPELFQLVLNRMLEEGQIETADELVMVKDFNVTGKNDVHMLFVRIEEMYRQYGLQPDTTAEMAEHIKVDRKRFQEAIYTLVRSGHLIRICKDFYLHPEHLERGSGPICGDFLQNTPFDAPGCPGTLRHFPNINHSIMEYLDRDKNLPSGRGREKNAHRRRLPVRSAKQSKMSHDRRSALITQDL